jgi:hypothetical protein
MLSAAFVLLPAASAQAQTTLTACYVPKSGTVYRIKVEGTPTKCGQNHVEFTWQSGASGLTGYAARKTTMSISSGGTTGGAMPCLVGEVVMGGGFTVEPLGADVIPRVNGPVGTDGPQAGWLVVVSNVYPGSIDLTITAICVPAPTPPSP